VTITVLHPAVKSGPDGSAIGIGFFIFSGSDSGFACAVLRECGFPNGKSMSFPYPLNAKHGGLSYGS